MLIMFFVVRRSFFCVLDLCRSRGSRAVHSCAEAKPAGLECRGRVGFPELLGERGGCRV